MTRGLVAIFVAAAVLFCATIAYAGLPAGAVRVISSSAPLLKHADHHAEAVRSAELDDVFPLVDVVNGFYLVKDPVTKSFLFLDQLDVELVTPAVSTKSINTYIRKSKFDLIRLELPRRGIRMKAGRVRYDPADVSRNSDYRVRSSGSSLVDDALSYRGVPYVYGGSSYEGMDCSGLTQEVLAHEGIDVPHRASLQAEMGTLVDKRDLQPGDLVFFRDRHDPDFISHVGIYLGGGRFVHASSGLRRVDVSSLDEPYYSSHFALARRF
jgi:cell wall-associated NlpC family hydrolase